MGISEAQFREMIANASDELLSSPDLQQLGIKVYQKPAKTEPIEDPAEPTFKSDLERKFWDYAKYFSLEFIPQYSGWSQSKMSIDFYHEQSKIGVELNGGAHYPEKINGQWYVKVSGHNSHDGLMRDFEKSLLAASHGIQIIFIGSDHLSKSEVSLTFSKLQSAIAIRCKMLKC